MKKRNPDEQMQKARGLHVLGLDHADPDQKLEAFMRVFHPKQADDFTVGKNRVARAREEAETIQARKLPRRKK
jgi:hypothetical protein